MMQRFFVEADLMLRDTASAWTLNSTRVDYIYHEGTGNMHWAMYDLTNQHLNRVVGLYMRVEVFHVVVFVLSWLLALVFLFCMLRPFMGKTKVGGGADAKMQYRGVWAHRQGRRYSTLKVSCSRGAG